MASSESSTIANSSALSVSIRWLSRPWVRLFNPVPHNQPAPLAEVQSCSSLRAESLTVSSVRCSPDKHDLSFVAQCSPCSPVPAASGNWVEFIAGWHHVIALTTSSTPSLFGCRHIRARGESCHLRLRTRSSIRFHNLCRWPTCHDWSTRGLRYRRHRRPG